MAITRWYVCGLLLLSVVALVVAGCGGSGDGATGDLDEWVLGVWEAYQISATVDGDRAESARGQYELVVSFEERRALNGLVIVEGNRTDFAGRWARVAGGYLATYDGEGGPPYAMFHRRGDELYVRTEQAGSEVYLWLHRL